MLANSYNNTEVLENGGYLFADAAAVFSGSGHKAAEIQLMKTFV